MSVDSPIAPARPRTHTGMPDASGTTCPHRVAMLVYPDAQLLDISGPLEVFARTARWLVEHGGRSEPVYRIELVAREAGAVRTSGGLALLVGRDLDDCGAIDTLLVSGGIGCAAACADAVLLDWLRDHAGRVQRLGSICNGALLLAAAGLLDGREATTHWAYLDRLAERSPGCRVDRESIYVRSGHLYTSAGVTAGIDLALGLVEADWGKSVAVAVAQELVVYRRRSARQPQLSRFLEAERREDRFGALQTWLLDHLAEPLPVERMAERMAMSPRHFSRRFGDQFGCSPAAYVARLRLEEACRRIESGAGQLKDVARQCGFGDEQALRRAFRRGLGQRPRDFRAALVALEAGAAAAGGAIVDAKRTGARQGGLANDE